MTDSTTPNGRINIGDVYRLVERSEAKQDRRWERLEAKLDARDRHVDGRFAAHEVKITAQGSRIDRIEGGLGVIRWLGPAGVGAVLLGLLTMAGAFMVVAGSVVP